MKCFEIILHDDAIADMKNALVYYGTIYSSLAEKFKESVENTFTELKKNPFYQIRYDNVRMRIVKGFPYVIHFVVDEKANSVFVYGIRNSSQYPSSSWFYKE